MFDIQSASIWGQIFWGFMDSKVADTSLTNKQKKRLRSAWENDNIFRLLAAHYIGITFYTMGDLALENGEDLPEGIDPWAVKMSLIQNGCFFLRNKVLQSGKEYPGVYAQSGYPIGIFNINLAPLKGFVTNLNGSEGQEIDLYVPTKNSPGAGIGQGGQVSRNPSGVIIWDNAMRIPAILYALKFAYYIADSYRTLDKTRTQLKVPIIFTVPSKNLANDINNIYDSADLHEQYVVQDESLNQINKVELFETNTNGQNLKDVTGLIQWYDAQFLKMRGIKTNSQMDKKGENLQTAEITIDNMITEINRKGPIDTKNYYLKLARNVPGLEEYPFIWSDGVVEEIKEEEKEEEPKQNKQDEVSENDDNGSNNDDRQE